MVNEAQTAKSSIHSELTVHLTTASILANVGAWTYCNYAHMVNEAWLPSLPYIHNYAHMVNEARLTTYLWGLGERRRDCGRQCA